MDNGWQEYKKLFENLLGTVDRIDRNLNLALVKIAKLEERGKIMAAFWGTLGGGLAVAVSLAIRFMSH